MDNQVLIAFHLSKEYTAAFNNYLTVRYNIQRANRKNPAIYTRENMREAKVAMLATWKPLKRAMRFAIEYKQL